MTKAEKQAKRIADAKAFLALHEPAIETTSVVVIPQEPVVLEKNKVVFSLIQDTTKKAKRKNANGIMEEYDKVVKHNWEAHFESEEPIETAPLSEWILSNLANYQIMQQFQGKSRFDTVLPIMFNMVVNNTNALMGVKFSTNAKTIERLIEKAPSIMTRVFNPTSTQYTVDSDKRRANRNELKGFLEGSLNTTLAARIEKIEAKIDPITEVSKLLEAPVEE
jgi:hypothetical protein